LDEQGYSSVLKVVIKPEDTANIFGKYIYQITVKDGIGRTTIPSQGVLFITKNINAPFAVGN
jgi:hypothetical protein